MNKGLITNLIAFAITTGGYFSPWAREQLFSIGIFSLSGAVTNWLAVHMLFEKVPFLYGSGVIPARFEDFKAGIKNLILKQFFTRDNIDRFFHDPETEDYMEHFDFDSIIEKIDYDKIFDDFISVIEKSPFGGMLGMFGGPAALAPLKAPFIDKMKTTVKDITHSHDFATALGDNMTKALKNSNISNKIEGIIDKRLNELTPQMVKEIIQEMIKAHLGWLVVWGGVFGGLIGLGMSIFES